VDGDTCDIDVDLGFSIKTKLRFRLHGINTPEHGQPGYAAAKEFLTKYLNQPVTLQVTKLDKYGRYLAVILTSEGLSVNQMLLDASLAVPFMV
jgi:micrococcal nuclease